MSASERLLSLRLLGVCVVVNGCASACTALVSRARDKFSAFICDEYCSSALEIGVTTTASGWHAEFENRSADFTGDTGLDDLIRLVVVRERQDMRFIHASCVAGVDGAAIFVGATTSGKSTLALALFQNGWELFSDDIAPVLFENKLVCRFPTAANLRSYTQQLAARMHWNSHAHNPEAPTERDCVGLPIRAVFILNAMEAPHEPAYATRKVPVEWRQMLELCFPPNEIGESSNSGVVVLRDESTFNRPPKLQACSRGTGLRHILNHRISPQPSLTAVLAELCPVFENAKFFFLDVGHLPETTALVEKALEGVIARRRFPIPSIAMNGIVQNRA
jgi:hypothetical protein